MTRLTAEQSGERAFDALGSHIGGLNRRMWCYHAALSPSQLSRAIDWLRDLFDGRLPFVRVRRGGEEIYVLALDNRDVREYMERRLLSQITRAKRDYNELHGFAKEHPSRENAYQEELARHRVAQLTHAYDSMFGEVVTP